MALLTKKEMKHIPIVDNEEEAQFGRVVIDLDNCNGCKMCTIICPTNVLELYGPKHDKKVRLKEGLAMCLSCDNCHAICEYDAIDIKQTYNFAGRYRQINRGAPVHPRRSY
ncbi:MAG: 4Fe-4S dicluster domain-containing protein [Halieaceae bacterium]|jgi:formate hydrogenlyase subunit 6/NADH:ubiquinone oxidoreductase subunit I|nr:4Fe-4S dicluster domain-containing protein [Halieaceae bacterium]